ncbi:MAG: alpha-amylase domain-containing protein [Polyangiaceae bacterium]
MGVIMQAFYWNAPAIEGKEAAWWGFLQTQLADLANDGFTALWLPPPSKAAEWNSMGYDPYDYFDLGEFPQKGRKETWFGSKQALVDLITAAHTENLQVYSDMVLNHNSGADAEEPNPLLNGALRWTKFTPASKRFGRDWTCFHPSPFETNDGGAYGDMPDLCHRNPTVYGAMLEYARWLIEVVGYDGFRFDFVGGFGPWLVKAIAEYRYRDPINPTRPFCVGECWASDRTIDDWLGAVNTFMDNPVSAFDFPLHYQLKKMCDSFGFDLRELTSGTALSEMPNQVVTFVDNHDTVRDSWNSVINNKIMAYAVILTHEGYPCVFWQDYFNFGLAERGAATGIAALVTVHEHFAGGATQVLYADQDVYVMQRTGYGTQPGLVLVLNNRGDSWQGPTVVCQWKGQRLQPVAWCGAADRSRPNDKWTDSNGAADLWAPPRGYAVYVPE